MNTPLTHELLISLVDYDPATGLFRWRKRDRSCFLSDQDFERWEAKAGHEIGAVFFNQGEASYIQIYLQGTQYNASRLAFFYVTGRWPIGDVMHVDRCGTNNAWSNLKEVTRMDNMKNLAMTRRNSSGCVGVSWNRQKGKWHAFVMVGHKTKHLGYFSLKEDAIKARLAANKQLGFDPMHGKRYATYADQQLDTV